MQRRQSDRWAEVVREIFVTFLIPAWCARCLWSQSWRERGSLGAIQSDSTAHLLLGVGFCNALPRIAGHGRMVAAGSRSVVALAFEMPMSLSASSFASDFCGMRAIATTAVPASTPAEADRLPPSHQCRPGTRRRWHIPWQGFVLPHSMTSSNRADNRRRVPLCDRLRSRARDWFVTSPRSPARAPHIRYRVASSCREYSAAASLARSFRAASWPGAAHAAVHRERWRRPTSRSARLRP
jgi:hypothetical protein